MTTARVDSIAMLRRFRAALVQFAQVAGVALEEVDMEMQRTLTWLQQDRIHYWKTKVRDRADVYTQAKQALNQRQIFERTLQGVPSSCVDERKALKVAEQGLRDAEQGLLRARSWIRQMEREQNEYRGRIKGLSGAIQVEIPNAMAGLDGMVDSLQAYVALAPPEAPRPEEATAKEGVLMPMPEEQGEDKDKVKGLRPQGSGSVGGANCGGCGTRRCGCGGACALTHSH